MDRYWLDEDGHIQLNTNLKYFYIIYRTSNRPKNVVLKS